MNLIPYKMITLESDKNPVQLKDALNKLVSKPDWNININKIVNNRVLEGKISERGFTIVMGRYGLTFGMTSLLPIMKGKIRKKDFSTGSSVSIVIRPFWAGILILSVFYLLCLAGIYFSIQKNLMEVLIVCCVFVGVTYFSLISKFNKECKVYTQLIENNF